MAVAADVGVVVAVVVVVVKQPMAALQLNKGAVVIPARHVEASRHEHE